MNIYIFFKGGGGGGCASSIMNLKKKGCVQILHADMAGGMGQSKIPFNCVIMVINCKPSHYRIVQFQAIVLENLVPYSTSKYVHCAYLKLHMIWRAPWCADFSPLPVSYTKVLKTEVCQSCTGA